MRKVLGPRVARVSILVVAIFALAGGIAYATIPDGGGTYTACVLKNVGTIRLIDPSAPSTSLLSHCTALETQVTWNQQGQRGAAGANGADGVSPTVTQLPPTDSHCAAGGAAITDASGSTAYVCSGRDGKDGKSFAGTFTSLNGQFTLSVGDSGVQITGPGASISLDSSGNLVEQVAGAETIAVGAGRTVSIGGGDTTVVGGGRSETIGAGDTLTVGTDRTEKVSGNETISVTHDRSEKVSGNAAINVLGNRTDRVSGTFGLLAAGTLQLEGSLLDLNSGPSCRPAARVGDQIDTVNALILTGAPNVCIG